jgi:hypothetical protein
VESCIQWVLCVKKIKVLAWKSGGVGYIKVLTGKSGGVGYHKASYQPIFMLFRFSQIFGGAVTNNFFNVRKLP